MPLLPLTLTSTKTSLPTSITLTTTLRKREHGQPSEADITIQFNIVLPFLFPITSASDSLTKDGGIQSDLVYSQYGTVECKEVIFRSIHTAAHLCVRHTPNPLIYLVCQGICTK